MNRYNIKRYRPNFLGILKEAKYGEYINIDDYDRKLNKLERRLMNQQNNHNHIDDALFDTAKALSTLPQDIKHQFIMTMLKVSPDTHNLIIQLKSDS